MCIRRGFPTPKLHPRGYFPQSHRSSRSRGLGDGDNHKEVERLSRRDLESVFVPGEDAAIGTQGDTADRFLALTENDTLLAHLATLATSISHLTENPSAVWREHHSHE